MQMKTVMRPTFILALLLLVTVTDQMQAQRRSSTRTTSTSRKDPPPPSTWQSGERQHLLVHLTTAAAFPIPRINSNTTASEFNTAYTGQVYPEMELLLGLAVSKAKTLPKSTTYLFVSGRYGAYTPGHTEYMVGKVYGQEVAPVGDMPENYRWSADVGVLAASWFRLSAGFTQSAMTISDKVTGRQVRKVESSPHVMFGIRVRFGETVIGCLEQSVYYSADRPGTYTHTSLGVGVRLVFLTE